MAELQNWNSLELLVGRRRQCQRRLYENHKKPQSAGRKVQYIGFGFRIRYLVNFERAVRTETEVCVAVSCQAWLHGRGATESERNPGRLVRLPPWRKPTCIAWSSTRRDCKERELGIRCISECAIGHTLEAEGGSSAMFSGRFGLEAALNLRNGDSVIAQTVIASLS